MDNPVKIQLSPYTAVVLKQFLRSQVKPDRHYIGMMKAISKAVDEYETQVLQNISVTQIEEILDEQSIFNNLNQE